MLKQGKKQIKLYMLTLAFSALVIITLLFFLGDVLTADGREYIPNSASNIALVLCVLWQCVLVIGIYRLQKKIKEFSSGWIKKIVTITATGAAIFLVLVLAWNWFLYTLKLNERIGRYDEHIALYVTNTFVRPQFRDPHYMYEENWLFMRNLSEDELNEAIHKYGDPDNYYNYN